MFFANQHLPSLLTCFFGFSDNYSFTWLCVMAFLIMSVPRRGMVEGKNQSKGVKLREIK